MNDEQVRVSIGLPVYNGEKFIAQALDSLLTQTFQDFELIISDNGSTDKTEKICRAYAANDRRIRYYRNQQNLDLAWNYNRVFELSSGEYFKWAAHDDLHSPDFLWKCVEILDREPSVILCHSQVKFIDEQGKFLQNYDIELATDSPKPQERFHALLGKHLCCQCYGLIRARTLRMTSLMGNYAHADGVLLLRLALIGRFYEIPEHLFFFRKHSQQSMSLFFPSYLSFASQQPQQSSEILPNYHQYTVWLEPSKKEQIFLPHWRIFWEYCLSIWLSPVGWYERLCCFFSMSQQLKGKEYLLLKDLLTATKISWKRFSWKKIL